MVIAIKFTITVLMFVILGAYIEKNSEYENPQRDIIINFILLSLFFGIYFCRKFIIFVPLKEIVSTICIEAILLSFFIIFYNVLKLVLDYR